MEGYGYALWCNGYYIGLNLFVAVVLSNFTSNTSISESQEKKSAGEGNRNAESVLKLAFAASSIKLNSLIQTLTPGRPNELARPGFYETQQLPETQEDNDSGDMPKHEQMGCCKISINRK